MYIKNKQYNIGTSSVGTERPRQGMISDYQSTGLKWPSNIRILDYPFGQYMIKVAIDENNQFQGILEISQAKDFRSLKQKIASVGFHDVEDLYKD